MRWAMGDWAESPQRTHWWNNRRLTAAEVAQLNQTLMAKVRGDKTAVKRYFLRFFPLFHIPRLGGWRRYAVLVPEDDEVPWRVGWVAPDVAGISQIPVVGLVRVLRGPGDTKFFGVDQNGEQVQLYCIALAELGDPRYRHLLLH